MGPCLLNKSQIPWPRNYIHVNLRNHRIMMRAHLWGFNGRTGIAFHDLQRERSSDHINGVQPLLHFGGHLAHKDFRLLVILEADAILTYQTIEYVESIERKARTHIDFA